MSNKHSRMLKNIRSLGLGADRPRVSVRADRYRFQRQGNSSSTLLIL